jgi:hypothetical protein
LGRRLGLVLVRRNNPQKTTSTDYTTDCQSSHVPARQLDWIYTRGYPVLNRLAGRGVDGVSLVKPLPCTEQFGTSSSVSEVTSTTGIPPSLSETTIAPGMRCRTSFPSLQHFQQRDK